MSGRRERELERDRIEHADERGDERRLSDRAHDAVDGVEHRDRIGVDQRRGADALAHARHRDRRVQPFAGDVADRDHDAPVGQPERVVPVAAHGRFQHRRLVDRLERQPGDLRQRRHERRFLERRRDAALALVAVALPIAGAMRRPTSSKNGTSAAENARPLPRITALSVPTTFPAENSGTSSAESDPMRSNAANETRLSTDSLSTASVTDSIDDRLPGAHHLCRAVRLPRRCGTAPRGACVEHVAFVRVAVKRCR